MRNLKKFLALVLAMMMVFSLMITVNASHVKPGTKYGDDEKITSKYDEAIQVLSGLGIYKGYDGTISTFKPGEPITRAEVTALVYRILSGDVNDKQITAYEGYATNNFTDVASGYGWARGYIGYVSNGLYVVGDGHGHFYPGNNITGYEALAIILRAIGYDQWDEFKGPGWEQRVATTAQQLGILEKLDKTDGDLKSPATREVVAQMLFSAIAQCSTVNFDLVKLYDKTNTTLAYKNFGLYGGGNGTGGYWDTIGNVAGAYGYGSDAAYTVMTNRADAVADNIASAAGLAAAVNKGVVDKRITGYGAPVAVWFYKNGTNADYPIFVRFNYAKQWHDGVVKSDIYAAAVAEGVTYSNNKITITAANYSIDGVAQSNTDFGAASAGGADATTSVAGKGVEVALYTVEKKDGSLEAFVTVANTYVARWGYTSSTATGLIAAVTSSASSPASALAAPSGSTNRYTYGNNTSGSAVDNVVTFHQYTHNDNGTTNTYSDYETLRVAAPDNVTVTDTYKPASGATAANSYILLGSVKKEYNDIFAKNGNSYYLTQVIMDRDASAGSLDENVGAADAFDAKQILYYDEHGYIVYTTDAPATTAKTGYLLLREASYYSRYGDNYWLAQYSVIFPDDNSSQVIYGSTYADGADDGADGYFTKGTGTPLATNYSANPGLYAYTQNANGYYTLVPVTKGVDVSKVSDSVVSGKLDDILDGTDSSSAPSGNRQITKINRNDPKALITAAGTGAAMTQAIVTENTIFYVAIYNNDGGIIGYNRYVGLHAIPNMTVRSGNTGDAKDKSLSAPNYLYVEYVFKGTANADAYKEAAYVLVRNAKESFPDKADENESAPLFYLLDETPIKWNNEYNKHTVLWNGTVMEKQFTRATDTFNNDPTVKDGDTAVLYSGGDAAGNLVAFTAGFYKAVKSENNYTMITKVEKVDEALAASDTFKYYAGGVLESTSGNKYMAVASGCQVYLISGTTVTPTTVDKLVVGGGVSSYTIYVAHLDGYGAADIIYAKAN